LETIQQSFSGHSFLHGLLNRLESVKFALDWKHMGHQLGGNVFKRAFAQSVYLARTGWEPPTSQASKTDWEAFRAFKRHQKLTIAGRNNLLELFDKVPFLLCSQALD